MVAHYFTIFSLNLFIISFPAPRRQRAAASAAAVSPLASSELMAAQQANALTELVLQNVRVRWANGDARVCLTREDRSECVFDL